MPTLSEYAKLSQDEVVRGLFEEILTTNDLMGVLQFKSFSGNALAYKRENTLPAATTHVVGDIWTDSDPTFTEKSVVLQILGVQSALDRYAMATRSNINDQKAILFQSMAKGLAEKLETLIISGDPGTTSSEFEGLTSLILGESRMMGMDDGVIGGDAGSVETELTLDRLDALLDAIEPGNPTALIMNKTMRRKLTSLSRATGSGVLGTIEQFGRKIRTYNDIPIIISDRISNAEQYEDSSTWPSSTASTIYAVKFGEANKGYTVVHNGEILTPDIQELGTKFDANEDDFRIAIYLNAVTWSSKAVVALGGIDSAA